MTILLIKWNRIKRRESKEWSKFNSISNKNKSKMEKGYIFKIRISLKIINHRMKATRLKKMRRNQSWRKYKWWMK